MTRAPVLKVILLGAVFALCFSPLAQPSLAANDECAGDSGIPSGVIAPPDVGHLRKSLADAGFTVGGFYAARFSIHLAAWRGRTGTIR